MMCDLSGLASRLCSIDDNLQNLSKVVNVEALVQRMVDVDHFLNGARKRIMEQVQLSSVKVSMHTSVIRAIFVVHVCELVHQHTY